MAYNSVSVGASATVIVADNPQRFSLIITNLGPNTVFIGQDSAVTTVSGTPLLLNGVLTEDSGGQKVYCGPIWGISSGTSDIRYWERTR